MTVQVYSNPGYDKMLLKDLIDFGNLIKPAQYEEIAKITDWKAKLCILLPALEYVIVDRTIIGNICKVMFVYKDKFNFHKNGTGLSILLFISNTISYSYLSTKQMMLVFKDLAKKEKCKWIAVSKRIKAFEYRTKYINLETEEPEQLAPF